MKFCTKCGADLFDDAIICTKCGRMVEVTRPQSTPLNKTTPLSTATPPSPSALLISSNFIHSLGAALSLFFVILSIGLPYISAYFNTDKKGYITGVYANFYPDYELLVPAIILAGVTFLFGILSFVITLMEKHRGERLFSSVNRLVIGMISLVCAIVLMAY